MNASAPRILHLDTGRQWRGGQAQVFNLCACLARMGIEQNLACPPDSPLAKNAQAQGIAVMPYTGRSEWNLLAAHRLRRIVDGMAPTHLHAHDAHAHALARLALRRRAATRLIVSRRVDFPVSGNLLSRRKYLDPEVRFIAISNGVRDVLVNGGVAPERIYVVPSGVDPDRFSYNVPREKMRRELGIELDAPVVGNMGALVDHKGHRYLLEAMPTVLARYPKARCVILGEGPLRADLEKRAATLGIARAVVFAGYRADIEPFLASFDVFALASHLEGLCTSLIDAMLLGVPAVGTDTGGVPDLIQDGTTGLLVPPRNPEALARAIVELLENPERAQTLADAARRHARAHFTRERTAQATLEVYRRTQLA